MFRREVGGFHGKGVVSQGSTTIRCRVCQIALRTREEVSVSNSNKVLLILVVLVSLLVLGLGLFSKQGMFVALGVVILSTIVVIGGIALLRRAIRDLDPLVARIIYASIYLVLVILVIVQPVISIMAGIVMIVGPMFVFLVELRARSIEIGEGCLPVVLSIVGGLVLLLLSWLFERETFVSVIGSL